MDGLDRYYLVGDYDCGVSVYCHDHWLDGRPLIYYDGDDKAKTPYPDHDVAFVHTISGMLEEIGKHEKRHHKEN